MASIDTRDLPRGISLPVLISLYPKLIIGFVFSLFLLAIFQIYNPYTGELHINVDPSEKSLLGPQHEGWEFYQLARRTFGNDETIMLVVDADDVFSPQAIDLISRLTDRLSKVPGVHGVVSLTHALTIRTTGYGMDIAPIMEMAPVTPEDYEELRSNVLANPLIANTLISKGNDTTAILVNLENNDAPDFLGQVKTAIDAIIREEAAGGQVSITGGPLVKLATVEIILNDLVTFPPLITLVMMVLLWLLLRNVASIFIALITVIISVTWTVATITALGYSLNIITALVPPLLMIITLSYAMYVISDFRLSAQRRLMGDDRNAADQHKGWLPILLAGLTTATGFSSLYLSDLIAIREFGLFSVIGVIYATILALTFTPALLDLLQRQSFLMTKFQPVVKVTQFDHIINRVALFDAKHRISIFIIAGMVFIAGVAAMPYLRVGTEHITNFDPDSEVRRSFEHANDKLNGINPFNIVVQSQIPNAFKEPANLKAIESLQQWLESQPEIGGVTSLVNYIKFVNRAFNDNDPDFDKIPDSRKTIGQLLFFAGSDDTDRLVDPSYRAINILIRANVIDSDKVSSLVTRINTRLEQLPDHMVARATGNPVLMNQVIQDIMWGQVESIFLTLAIVYIILSSLFLSFKIGLIALIPNILPVVVYFGTLAITGISLNPATSLIAPMIIGVAVDDTIHYFANFNRVAKIHHDPEKATVITLGLTGRPMTYTSLVLCIGFLILTTSDLRMQAQVGVMASFSLLVAWMSDFFVTPALCSRMRIATLWDVLTLDLGERPQDTIPLFKGLSGFQARVVVRLASIREVESGNQLIEFGQPGKEMYTVIDGRLEASIENEGKKIKLGEFGRGDTFGEAGLFFATRTANVDVIEDARLVCITLENLEVLKRRYPGIAAQLFSNLNKILSMRLAHTNQRLT
ncbi:MAG: MMPL family transporter [Gammaproteobacteria bacterium]|nr:MMPL family transporter [Gammaproteobacteria bacterium]